MDCSICNEFFDENEHKPYSLNPCGHYFCIKCIQSLTTRSCPKCRCNMQSTTVNFAILDMLNDEVRPKSLKSPNPIRESRIFQSLDNMLKELTELEQSLAITLEKRISYIETSVKNMKKRIQNNTEKKVNALLNDNQKLLSLLDEKNAKTIEQLRNLSEDKRIKRNLKQFEQNFSKFNLNELSEKSHNFKRDIEQRIHDLNEFKLNFSLQIYSKSEDENQIGRIVDSKMLNDIHISRQPRPESNYNLYERKNGNEDEMKRPLSLTLPRLSRYTPLLRLPKNDIE